jgi:EpsI family protein
VLLGFFWLRIEQNKAALALPVLPTISYSLSGWVGHDAPLESQEADFWGRTYLMKRRYFRDQETVDFISSTSRPDRHNLHEPSGCYPSQGWRILNQETRWVETSQGSFPVRCLRLTRPDESTRQPQELFALFWFQQADGTTLARGLDLLFLAAKERLLLRPEKTWTLYSLASLQKNESDAAMWERLNEFARKLRTETVKPSEQSR